MVNKFSQITTKEDAHTDAEEELVTNFGILMGKVSVLAGTILAGLRWFCFETTKKYSAYQASPAKSERSGALRLPGRSVQSIACANSHFSIVEPASIKTSPSAHNLGVGTYNEDQSTNIFTTFSGKTTTRFFLI